MNQLELIKKYNIDVNNLDVSIVLGATPFKNIPKEDLEYLYLDLNLSQEEIGKLYNTGQRKISSYIEKYNLKKTKKQIQEKVKQTNKEKYGSEYYTQTDDYKGKAKQMMINRYGVENKNYIKPPKYHNISLEEQIEIMKKYQIKLSEATAELIQNGLILNDVIPKDELNYMYNELNLTQEEIAKLFKSSIPCIQKMLTTYDIKKRFKSQPLTEEKVETIIPEPLTEETLKIPATVNVTPTRSTNIIENEIKSTLTSLLEQSKDKNNVTKEMKLILDNVIMDIEFKIKHI